jgi:hypothetical protein
MKVRLPIYTLGRVTLGVEELEENASKLKKDFESISD